MLSVKLFVSDVCKESRPECVILIQLMMFDLNEKKKICGRIIVLIDFIFQGPGKNVPSSLPNISSFKNQREISKIKNETQPTFYCTTPSQGV